MNAYERYRSRLRGERVDRPPNFDIMMQRAAHHIGQPLSRYYLDHRVLVAANLAVMEDFHLDILQAISDPYREAADHGLEVEFPDDGLPLSKVPLLAEPADLRKLRPVAPEAGRRMSDRLEAIRLFRRARAGKRRSWVGSRARWPRLPICAGWARPCPTWWIGRNGSRRCSSSAPRRPSSSPGRRSRPAPTSSAWAKRSPHRFPPGCTASSPSPMNSASSPRSGRRARWARLHICGNTSRIVADMATQRRGHRGSGLDGGLGPGGADPRGSRGGGVRQLRPGQGDAPGHPGGGAASGAGLRRPRAARAASSWPAAKSRMKRPRRIFWRSTTRSAATRRRSKFMSDPFAVIQPRPTAYQFLRFGEIRPRGLDPPADAARP